MMLSMKIKVILPAASKTGASVPSLGLGTLMASLTWEDEITVTAEQAQRPEMWEDADVVVLTVGAMPMPTLNLAELYRIAGTQVVLIGHDIEFLAESNKQRQTIFVGRTEELWPAFLADFRRGQAGNCYASDFTVCGGLRQETLHSAIA
jgi:hypothetical protein